MVDPRIVIDLSEAYNDTPKWIVCVSCRTTRDSVALDPHRGFLYIFRTKS